MKINANMKILIVDDMRPIRTSMKSILERLGFTNIAEASDGLEALSLLKQEKQDLLITDWNMPNMDGISLVRMVRADEGMKHMPIVMLTAEAERDHVVEAIKVGISDYIVKPFTAGVVQRKIEAVLEKMQQAAEQDTAQRSGT